MRGQCSKSQSGRTVKLNPYESVIARYQGKLRDETVQQIVRKRKAIIEPIFALVKEIHPYRRFTVRGIENVKTQWSMLCTAINLNKIYTIWKSLQPRVA